MNIETDLDSLLDPDFKKEVIRGLNEIRQTINRSAEYYKKEIETIKMSQLKENSIAEEKS